MLTRIIIYYWDPLRSHMKNFLWGTIIKEYMENGDTTIIENHHSSYGWHLVLQEAFDNKIDIVCKLMTGRNAVRAVYADYYYLQDYLYYHGDKEALEELEYRRSINKAPIYIFNENGVIGEWSIN